MDVALNSKTGYPFYWSDNWEHWKCYLFTLKQTIIHQDQIFYNMYDTNDNSNDEFSFLVNKSARKIKSIKPCPHRDMHILTRACGTDGRCSFLQRIRIVLLGKKCYDLGPWETIF